MDDDYTSLQIWTMKLLKQAWCDNVAFRFFMHDGKLMIDYVSNGDSGYYAFDGLVPELQSLGNIPFFYAHRKEALRKLLIKYKDELMRKNFINDMLATESDPLILSKFNIFKAIHDEMVESQNDAGETTVMKMFNDFIDELYEQ